MVTFTQLKELESQVLQTIRTEGVFGRLNTLKSAAYQAQIVKAAKVPINLHLSFTLPTRLREDAGRKAIHRSFHVGCNAVSDGNGNISQLSYSVLIGEEAHPSKRVARKFHFDFEPVSTRNNAEPKPTFHLQMCGELSSHHCDNGYAEEDIAHLLPAWSQPRVPAQPMSLALILNWLFIEFGQEPSIKDARINPRWRSLVRDAERAILKPYYDDCSKFFSANANDDDSFLSKIIYEES